ncbi:MAG: chromosomal replication initiator protein DnaA [Chloroflexi bacterium]|nr:chromosomal replication initiator protein DnaA [Chloroflexota bacterium]
MGRSCRPPDQSDSRPRNYNTLFEVDLGRSPGFAKSGASPLNRNEAQTLWSAALGYLQVEIPRPNFETWLKDTVALNYEGDQLTVGTTSAFAAAMLERRLSSTIGRAVDRVAKRPTRVSFEVVAAEHPTNGAVQRAVPSPNGSPPSAIHADAGGQEATTMRLNPRFNFDSFVVGPSNELAHAAATAVTESPGRIYNPLYIYSKVGLGKTHLLHAMAHRLLAKGLSAIYVSSERYTNEYIKGIREGTADRFRDRYRGADILLIDDIQFIAGKEQTQEGFFHTFNELHLLGKQVVATGDEPAHKTLLEERIKSRLGGGLVVDIQPPNYEMRMAILRAKADALGVTLSHAVLDLLARRALMNIRELEGCLNRIVAYAQLTRSPITAELATCAVADLFTTTTRQPVKPDVVLAAVAEHFGIEAGAITGRRRDKQTALARRVAMYLLREESQLSSTRVGLTVGGKDHSTVLYAQKHMEQQLENDPGMRQELTLIRQSIGARRGA